MISNKQYHSLLRSGVPVAIDVLPFTAMTRSPGHSPPAAAGLSFCTCLIYVPTREVGGGAWPFLVGGAICLVNSDNERDSSLLNSSLIAFVSVNFLEGQVAFSHTRLSNK